MDTTDNAIFTDIEKDVIGEMMNISLGSSATSLSSLLAGKRVDITVPQINVVRAGSFNFENLEPAVGVEIKYVSGLDGINLMVLKKADVKAIVEILLGMEIPEDEFVMDEISISAICEVMNQMMGSAATALANFLGKPVNISPPIAYEIEDKGNFMNRYFTESDYLVAVSFNLKIQDVIDSEFINAIPIELAREIIKPLIGDAAEDTPKASAPKPEASRERAVEKKSKKPEKIIEEEYDDYDDEEDEEEEEEYVRKPRRKPKPKSNVGKKRSTELVNVKPMEYESFDDEEDLTDEQLSNLDLIMTVPLQVSVEIGKTKKKIKEILEFSQGTILELDKQAGAQVDVIINGQIIARGDVVLVSDNFGVRITEIAKRDELIKLTL